MPEGRLFNNTIFYTALSFSAPTQKQHHAISLYGQPKYGPDSTHFNYINPIAPKGGALKQRVLGHFDTLTPYIDRGTAAVGSHMIHPLDLEMWVGGKRAKPRYLHGWSVC
ncbi:hypothetical protein ACH42_04660 [Endozoicomonas sp. (ex Bugula neritina AB1)]|nr:hypothetical protein ACH42_04660 [Endozoicomonas sp. (ex Bugula neritina AB1)]